MLISSSTAAFFRRRIWKASRGSLQYQSRGLLTLAIETSCDDTSVAIVEKDASTNKNSAKIHFLENITADTREYRGIHPLLALESHQENLAKLVNKALKYLPVAAATKCDGSKLIYIADGSQRRKPDFISTTRGPGMRSNLFVGLDTGKALAVAWQIPFVGVHHMQAHLLTPRLVSSLHRAQNNGHDFASRSSTTPEFPFLSILVSGGHSILVKSSSITDHEILASSVDIAIGDSLDKSAREVLPTTLLDEAQTTMYAKLLEQYAFPNGSIDYADYNPPKSRGDEIVKRENQWGWSITPPFANTRELRFGFSSIATTVTKVMEMKKKAGQSMIHEERVHLAREIMRVAFEHLASRTVIALESLRLQAEKTGEQEIKTLVVSGGVAANRFLMAVLRSFLDVRGFANVEIVAPPPYLCTDNAAMIGWAGIEMFEAGWRTDLSSKALRKWTLDPRAEDGGILGPSGWERL